MEEVLNKLRTDPAFAANITHWEQIPPKAARYEPFPQALDSRLQRLLATKGIGQLYTHQSQAFSHVAAGRDIVVVTPTASGKTLCYNLPVLQTLLANPEARALYLFPTKALAQDQVAELMAWSEELGHQIKTYTYDGDTSPNARRAIRSAGNIVVTNPDMLHSGILPHHTKWMRLFENLRYIVIDELHAYRGVFGSHVANVLRRLERICSFYGSQPQYICASATIANPGEHAAALTGRDVMVIDENGAPQGPREIIFYNPPVVNKTLGIRRSALLESQRIGAEFLARDIQTIVFARSRIDIEVLTTYLRRGVQKLGDLVEKVRGYRGGYLPQQRRQIERELREGQVLGVVSTNALELGIDIGTLQAAVLTGYPGTIASTWQQAGRAGRGRELSAVVLVANSSPLNQFIINHPEFLLEQGAERALINPDNLFILISHLKCASFELPFQEGELYGGTDVEEILDFLVEEGLLRRVQGRYFWMSESYPAANISLRSASADNFVVIDTTGGISRVIGEVDLFSAPMLIHPGAIYMHQSQQYHIDRLDWDQRKAYARRVKVDYYTDANLAVELKVLDVLDSQEGGQVNCYWGEVMVTAQTHMYKKIRFYTHENIGWGPLSLPEQQMHTTSFWLTADVALGPGVDSTMLQDILTGVANLLLHVAPLELMCEPGDLGVVAQVRSPFTRLPTIYIYEKYPGGVGLAQRMYETVGQLLARARQLLAECPCEGGCPSCVGPLLEAGPQGKLYCQIFLEGVMGVAAQGQIAADDQPTKA
ncbi:MAG: DEAD/DEAH box helicase [Limnochordia bacterium]|jgi:DEAD/DEAH box helicase domain-containing protein